jgi:SSS family transporter
MTNFLRCLCGLLFFALPGGLTAQTKSPISLKTTPLSAPEVSAAALAPALAAPLPALDGPAAGVTPLAQLAHDGFTWLLAQDAAGATVWLRHRPAEGWLRRAAPPARLRPEIQAGGQAHILAVATDGRSEAAICTYHAVTNTWAEIARTPLAGALTAITPARNGFILSTRDAAGATRHTLVTIVHTKRLLQWLDWTIIVVYLAGTAAIGLYYYLKSKKQSNAEFFVGGRSIPWWAAGVSLYATGTSAISYIAIPAKSFDTNWLYLASNVIGLVGNCFVAIWVVPLIRRLNLMSVYHYLEMRFHPNIRVLASALAIVLQLGGRMSIVLFLPSLAMAAVTGLNVTVSILIMGVVTIVYTCMGGMKAVIWTDFIQVFVMLGGAFFAIGYMVLHIDGGFTELLRVASADDKMRIFDWSFDLTKATVWGFLLAAIIGVITYPQDQVMMQRVLSTKSDKEAGWSMWTLAAIVVPGSFTFFAIGTVLYVFYQQHPDHLNPLLNVDSTFPQFIASELPVGITGLLIAGIFAASMSTLASCINSVATLVSVDFYERYAKNPSPATSVRLAEWMTVVGGLIGVGTALLLAMVDIKSALDKSFELAGLLGGGFAGCYGLGLFTRRANWQGAAIGVLGSLIFTFVAWMLHLVHPVFYLMIAVVACLVVGYVASWFFPAPRQSLEGLTIYTPRKTALAASA